MNATIYVTDLRAEDVHARLNYGADDRQCSISLGDVEVISHSRHRSVAESVRFLKALREAVTESLDELEPFVDYEERQVCPFCGGAAKVAATSLLIEGDETQHEARIVDCVCIGKTA